MKKFLKLAFSLLFAITMITGLSPSLQAAETGSMTHVQDQYIWPGDTAGQYYLAPFGEVTEPGVPFDDTQIDTYNKLYTEFVDLPEPTLEEDTDTYYTGLVLSTYNFHYDALPSEMTFYVIDPSGNLAPLTIDTSSGDLLLSGAYWLEYDRTTNAPMEPFIESALFVWQDGVAYEIYFSQFYGDSASTYWATIFEFNDIGYSIIYEDTVVTIEEIEQPPAEEEEPNPEVDPPVTNNEATNDVTKVVNGPSDANAAMIAITAGSAALFALVTIIRRR